jgi:hypothetical protein
LKKIALYRSYTKLLFPIYNPVIPFAVIIPKEAQQNFTERTFSSNYFGIKSSKE